MLRALFAAFLLRALIPLGYMPAALAGGLPFVLCPDNLPVAVSAMFESHGHGHDHHGPDSSVVDQCTFGDLVPDAGAAFTVAELAVTVVAAPAGMPAISSFTGRAGIRPIARGPPA